MIPALLTSAHADVPTSGDRAPVALEPVFAEATWEAEGESAESFGQIVSQAGDVNGDGYDDLIVGAPSRPNTGAAYVFTGSSAGLSVLPATTLVGAGGSGFGGSAVGVGDLNADGYDDLLVGAQYDDGARGEIAFFLGSSSGIPEEPTLEVAGDPGSYLGDQVAGAGDVDGDGYDDAVAGAYYANTGAGRFVVYDGGAAGPATSTIWEGDAGAHLGCAVDGGLDVNADGYSDVIVGSYDATNTGLAYVFHGSALGVGAVAETTLRDGETGDLFGGRVAALGDVDADGFDDVAVSAPYAADNTGRVFVYGGSPQGVLPAMTASQAGDSESSLFGWGISPAEDVNLDGFADVVVGAPEWTGLKGRAWVYPGSSLGLTAPYNSRFDGPEGMARFGTSVSELGDSDGDGTAEIVVGAWALDSENGAVYVYEATDVEDAVDSGEPDDSVDDPTEHGTWESSRRCGCETAGGSWAGLGLVAALLRRRVTR